MEVAELDRVTIIVNKLSLDADVHPFTQKKTNIRENGGRGKSWFLSVAGILWDGSSPELLPSSRKCPFGLKRAHRQQPLFTQQSCLWRAGQRPRPHYVHTLEHLKGFSGL